MPTPIYTALLRSAADALEHPEDQHGIDTAKLIDSLRAASLPTMTSIYAATIAAMSDRDTPTTYLFVGRTEQELENQLIEHCRQYDNFPDDVSENNIVEYYFNHVDEFLERWGDLTNLLP